MPKYQVTLDGKTFVLEGDHPPSEAEARHAIEAHTTAAPSNTGMSTADLQAANLKGRDDLPSASGGLMNLAKSAGRFVSDAASGMKTIAEEASPIGTLRTIADPTRGLRMLRALPGALASGAKQRYGGIDQALHTAYTDPVGVAADVSTVAGGVGAAAKLGGAGKLARVAGAVSEATNPARLMEPVAKAVEYGTAGAIRPMLKPSKMLRRQQDFPLEIERTALKEGAVTGGLAEAKQNASAKAASGIAANAAGAVAKDRLVQMPKSLQQVERGLSHDSDLATLAQVEKDAAGSLPDQVTASQLLDKRRYLDRQLNDAYRAAERGGPPVGIKQSGQKEMLGNIRGNLRGLAPNIAAQDDLTRRLALVKASIGDANLRAGDIPMAAALLGGGMAVGGIPGAGVAGTAFGVGRTFPQIPLAIGSVPVKAAAIAATPAGRRATLFAAMLDRLSGGQ